MALLKKSYPMSELHEWSDQIACLLEETSLFRQAQHIAMYHALPGEVQTASLLKKWFTSKDLWLPLVEGENLKLIQYTGEENLRKGAFGIWEPKGIAQDSIEVKLDLIITPGVAFDRQCNRLGRGKGFYDRLLKTQQAPKIGICYEFQLLESIPTESFDIPMDGVITEREIIGL